MAAKASAEPQVFIPPKELEKLKRWGEWADQHGLLDEYLSNLQTLNFRLSPTEAREWGEPKYPLPHLRLYMRFGQVNMLNVWFAVHEDLPLVYVKIFQFRTDYPKGQPPDDP